MSSFLQQYGLLIAVAAAGWVFYDARKRGKGYGGAFLWSLGTFLILIIFLPLWLFFRPPLPRPADPPPPGEQ